MHVVEGGAAACSKALFVREASSSWGFGLGQKRLEDCQDCLPSDLALLSVPFSLALGIVGCWFATTSIRPFEVKLGWRSRPVLKWMIHETRRTMLRGS